MNFRRKAIIAVLLFDSIGVEAQEVTMAAVKKEIKKKLKFKNFEGNILDLKEDSIGHAGDITELQNEIAILKEANNAHVKAMADLLEMVESLSSCCSRTSPFPSSFPSNSPTAEPFPSSFPSNSPTAESKFCFSTDDLKETTHSYLVDRGPVESTYGPIGSWCTKDVTSTSGLFWKSPGGAVFDEDISDWDLAKVEVFDRMFIFAETFNQDIREWDVGSGKSFLQMFRSAEKFNSDISPWDVSQSDTFYYMFRDAKSFSHCLNWKGKMKSSAKTVLMFYASPGSLCS